MAGARSQPPVRAHNRVHGVSSLENSRGPGALIRRDTWRFPAARGERRGGMDWFSSRAPYLVLQCNEIFTTRLSTLCPVRRVYMSVSMYRGRVHGPEHEAWPLSSQP